MVPEYFLEQERKEKIIEEIKVKGIQSAGTKEPGGGMVGSTSLALTRVRPLCNYYNWYRTCNALVEDKVGSARLRHEPTRYTVQVPVP